MRKTLFLVAAAAASMTACEVTETPANAPAEANATAEANAPATVDAAADCAPWYGKPSTGADELTYRVPLTALPGWPAAVTVTLYYQSLPPYYQADRYGLLAKCANPADPTCYPETRRLLYLASRLDTNTVIGGQRPIEGWKLKVGSVTRKLTAGGGPRTASQGAAAEASGSPAR